LKQLSPGSKYSSEKDLWVPKKSPTLDERGRINEEANSETKWGKQEKVKKKNKGFGGGGLVLSEKGKSKGGSKEGRISQIEESHQHKIKKKRRGRGHCFTRKGESSAAKVPQKGRKRELRIHTGKTKAQRRTKQKGTPPLPIGKRGKK